MDDQSKTTPAHLTVGALIATLQAYPPDRRVVFIDPDTEWVADVIVREPDQYEMREFDHSAPPVIVTGNPYD